MTEPVLRRGWAGVPIVDLVEVVKGRKPKYLGPLDSDHTLPYVNIRAFEHGDVAEYCSEREKIVPCNGDDTLIVWDGARAGLVGGGLLGAVGSTLARLRA
jgi:type I restriction enzyme S subunit